MEIDQKMIRNAIRCVHCDDVIESKHRHDFATCKCGTCFVDGGLDYQRIGFHNKGDYENLVEYANIPQKIWS